MGHSFHVDTDRLRQHAAAVDDFTTRADTAADAGRQVAGMDNAYGLLCRSIGGLFAGPQERCADSLGKAAQALRRITTTCTHPPIPTNASTARPRRPGKDRRREMTNPLIDSGTDVRTIYHQNPTSLGGEFSRRPAGRRASPWSRPVRRSLTASRRETGRGSSSARRAPDSICSAQPRSDRLSLRSAGVLDDGAPGTAA